jgi:hypothetical protein
MSSSHSVRDEAAVDQVAVVSTQREVAGPAVGSRNPKTQGCMNTCDRTWNDLVTGSLTTFHIGVRKWRNYVFTPFLHISPYQVFSVRVGGCNSDVVYKVIVCY